ncbi:MAG: hypothetical protein U5L07_05680 [Desulfobacterales bacterium]|nr:hypothetical protein [Desulfobacterales bacterium]
MKKITLKYTAGTAEGSDDLISPAESCEFIYGIAPEGLTPFEYALADKSPGDRIQYRVERARVIETFGHLLSNMGKMPIDQARFYLTIELTDVQEADQREVVRALAGTTACGGDCGCGCGGH